MSSPTAKEISTAFPKLTPEQAEELARALQTAVDSDDENAPDEAMEAANRILNGHNVEGIRGEDYQVDKYWMDTVLLYVNLGDTYDTTILYDTEDKEFSIGSWGDFMEAWEEEGDDDEDGDEEDYSSDEEDAEEEDAETEEA